MIINKRSWHYRWMKKVQALTDPCDTFEDPKSLCSYFWTFVGLSFKGLLLASVFISASAFVVLIVPILLWSWLHNHSFIAGFVLELITLVATIVLWIKFVPKCYGKVTGKASNDAKGTSFTGVVLGTVLAAKNKMCPLIKYEE